HNSLSKQKREIEAVEAEETEARNLTAAVETQMDVEAEMAVRRSMVVVVDARRSQVVGDAGKIIGNSGNKIGTRGKIEAQHNGVLGPGPQQAEFNVNTPSPTDIEIPGTQCSELLRSDQKF
ncbi:hypothetical protein A2U01_0037417, partial [Trifolium medium]|nr:hypothetical protein [Trifolium medium]